MGNEEQKELISVLRNKEEIELVPLHSLNSKEKKRKYACDNCNATFCKHAHVIRHQTIHSNERPFQCIQCESSYKRDTHLKRHIQSAHCEYKNESCDQCTKVFASREQLRRHMKRHSKTININKKMNQNLIEENRISTIKSDKSQIGTESMESSSVINFNIESVNIINNGNPESSSSDNKDIQLNNKINKKLKFQFVCVTHGAVCYKINNTKRCISKNEDSNICFLECGHCAKRYRTTKTLRRHILSSSGIACYAKYAGYFSNDNLNLNSKLEHNSQLDIFSMENDNEDINLNNEESFSSIPKTVELISVSENSENPFIKINNQKSEQIIINKKEGNTEKEILLSTIFEDKKNKKVYCPECGTMFSTRSNLNVHLEVIHMIGIRKEFSCKLCEFVTHYKNVLTRHIGHRHLLMDGGSNSYPPSDVICP